MDTKPRKFGPWVTAVWSQDNGWEVQWASVGPCQLGEAREFLGNLAKAIIWANQVNMDQG